jgi:hypothetical protein
MKGLHLAIDMGRGGCIVLLPIDGFEGESRLASLVVNARACYEGISP